MESIVNEGYTTEDSPMVRMSQGEVYHQFDDIVPRVASGEKRVIVTNNREDVAALISIEDFYFLERLVEELEEQIDLEAVWEAKTDHQKEGTVAWHVLKAELGLE